MGSMDPHHATNASHIAKDWCKHVIGIHSMGNVYQEKYPPIMPSVRCLHEGMM